MSKRYAILYDDGSFNVSSEPDDIEQAKKRLNLNEQDDGIKFVQVEIRILQTFFTKIPQIVHEHSAICPTCNTEVFIETNQSEGGK